MATESLIAFARRWGLGSEAPEYLKAVEAWRTAWKPPDSRVRVVVLAESHVAEQPGDADVRVTLPPGLHSPVELPSRYVRLVHCLGYGENGVCSKPAVGNDRGTIQYWDLFGALAYRSVDERQPRKGETPGDVGLRKRIAWKLATLELLRSQGIWLLDVSPVALYLTRGKRVTPGGSDYARLMREAFELFVEPQLRRFTKLEQTWIIGYQLAQVLVPSARSRLDRQHVIIQPQGERQHPGQLRKDLARMIQSMPRAPLPSAA